MISDRYFGVPIRSRCLACTLAATLAAASCGEVSMSPASPTKVDSPTASTASISAQSHTVIAEPVSHSFCPSVAPFNAPFVIVVRPNGLPGLVVTRVRMQFTDSAGVAMPPVTLAAPVPITQFGTALAETLADQRFSLRLGIGCGVGRNGTIVIQVDTRDAQGRMGSGQVRVAVR
jgi:hypothetical protein